jgi:hypothetical protein
LNIPTVSGVSGVDHKIGLAQTLLQSLRSCEIGHTDRKLAHPRINAEHAHAERGA